MDLDASIPLLGSYATCLSILFKGKKRQYQVLPKITLTKKSHVVTCDFMGFFFKGIIDRFMSKMIFISTKEFISAKKLDGYAKGLYIF